MNELIDYFNGEELPGNVWLHKYAAEGENTPDDMHWRLAKKFAQVSDQSAEFFYELMKNFKRIVPQGSVSAILGTPIIGSISNCFVIGQAYDSYGGIMKKDEEQVQLMKRRGGVGHDLSLLRPRKTTTNNAARSSTGAVSFVHRFSNSTREVAQEGRRGALMLSLDIRHPDSPEFAEVKADKVSVTGANISLRLRDDFMEAVEKDEDYILRFPIDQELPLFFTSELPEQVTVEHAYLEEWDGKLPKDTLVDFGAGKSVKKVKAKELYQKIVHNAWKAAEPGQLFIDRHWNYSPDGVYPKFRMVTTNPCGEIGMGAYDACRLIIINFLTYVVNPFTDEAYFDFEAFKKDVEWLQRMADMVVDLELLQIDQIIAKIQSDPEPIEVKRTELELWQKIRAVCEDGRRTGSGFTALADTLAALGVKYDSGAGIHITHNIMRAKFEAEIRTSIELAKEHGPFPAWDREKEFDMTSGKLRGKNDFFQMLCDEFPELAQEMFEHGRRNISLSTVAPTGTTSLMTQTTSGIEPVFLVIHYRKVKLDQNDDREPDFVDELGDRWIEYPVLHPQFKKWIEHKVKHDGWFMCYDGEGEIELFGEKTTAPRWEEIDITNKEHVEALFKQSPWYGCQAGDIDWIKRVEIQSVVQKYTTHSISATINLPETATEEEVGEIYIEAWKQGLKGITVYREGSRDGVLTSKSVKELGEELLEIFPQHDAPKRPKELDAHYYFMRSGAKKYAVIVGLLDGKPYEVFAFENPTKEEELQGKIIKVRRGVYKFESPLYTINNLQLSSEHTEEKLFTKLISQLLRHGARPVYLVDVIDSVELEINNFKRVVARVLKKYIQNGESSTLVCLECGSKEVIFQEGCQTCMSCGSSKCG